MSTQCDSRAPKCRREMSTSSLHIMLAKARPTPRWPNQLAPSVHIMTSKLTKWTKWHETRSCHRLSGARKRDHMHVCKERARQSLQVSALQMTCHAHACTCKLLATSILVSKLGIVMPQALNNESFIRVHLSMLSEAHAQLLESNRSRLQHAQRRFVEIHVRSKLCK